MRGHHLSPRGDGLIPRAPRWRLMPAPDLEIARALAATLSVPVPFASLLLQRDVATAEAARRFLRPALSSLADPLSLAGMAEAVALIVAAVTSGSPILVHGDYDVDGQCATAVLTRALRIGGAVVHPFVPHRMTDGYDFGTAGLTEAARVGAGLIITCDCGITAIDAVARAKAAGYQVIVTDHHLPGTVLPPADVVIDPQCAADTSALGMLCGTGVVFKLVQALVEPLSLPAALPHHLLDFVALATVADVVPLVGENRILVKHGLRVLAETRWPGLRAMLDQARLQGELRAGQVGFILAPRLNAVGRIAAAQDGLRLLLTDDEAEAAALARELDDLNRRRQSMDQRILEEVLTTIEGTADADDAASLVLAGNDWHPGVVGIVASRVVERFGRPTFLIGLQGDSGRGSGRSIDGFDLHAALMECSDLLERYGGHRMAAGLTIRRDRIDAFRSRFEAVARASLRPEDLGASQRVDVAVALPDLTPELERWSRDLEPCGMGNPGPVFGLRDANLENVRTLSGNHLKATLVGDGRQLDAIGFGLADRVPWLAGRADAAFRLEENVFNGRTTLQARLVALSPPGTA